MKVPANWGYYWIRLTGQLWEVVRLVPAREMDADDIGWVIGCWNESICRDARTFFEYVDECLPIKAPGELEKP